ncbi:MAG: FtsW/RodA/SpoVE family cell cycle protein, partial [Dehalococcoidia bacterium]|nr:FtsW/RodA/SpoVE family cell cycle protein [Dehalococcoidia bacterium]
TPFLGLLAAGLTAVVAIQSLIILGGVLRLMPLTGVTLPFVSYGGSSVVTNYVILGVILRIASESAARVSHDQQ